jgi:4,4'-diaponeurosporenoate glycosyltransferase
VETPIEHLSFFFNLNMVMGAAPDGLFGPLLLMDRDAYHKCGGHERVRDKVLEHFRMAHHAREVGIPVASAAGRGIVSFRMYPGGLADLVEGWTKGFASGAGQVSPRWMVVISAWLTGLMLAPVGAGVTGWAVEWLALYFAASAQLVGFGRRIGGFRWWWAPLYPVALVFFFGLFARSACRSGRAVTWKGREIRAD